MLNRSSSICLMFMMSAVSGVFAAATSSGFIHHALALQQFVNYRFEGNYIQRVDGGQMPCIDPLQDIKPAMRSYRCICPSDEEYLGNHINECKALLRCARCKPLIDDEWQQYNATAPLRQQRHDELRASYREKYNVHIPDCGDDGVSDQCRCPVKPIEQVIALPAGDVHRGLQAAIFPTGDQCKKQEKRRSFFLPSADFPVMTVDMQDDQVPNVKKIYWQRFAVFLGIPLIGVVGARLFSKIDPRILAALPGLCGIGYMAYLLTERTNGPSMADICDEEKKMRNGINDRYIAAIEQAHTTIRDSKKLTQLQVDCNEKAVGNCKAAILLAQASCSALNQQACAQLKDIKDHKRLALWGSVGINFIISGLLYAHSCEHTIISI